MIIRQPVYYERSHLAQDAFRDITWALGREANVQAKLAPLFCYQLECIKSCNGIFPSNLPPRKLWASSTTTTTGFD